MDTGPLVALLDPTDEHHGSCAELLEQHEGPLVVPSLCLAEAAHLAGEERWVSQVRLLMASAAGEISVEPVAAPDFERAAELVSQYRDLPLGTVDASIVAAAERLDLTLLATLDRRHFSVIRPAHAEAFTLVP